MAKAKAKAKSKVHDDEEEPQIADSEPEELEEESADADDLDADADAEEPADEEPEEPVEKKPAKPRARITKTALALILLNWIMVPVFLFFAAKDYVVRLQYSYRTTLNHIAVWGLPLRNEEDAPSLGIETRPRLVLSPDQLKQVKRPGLKSPSEPFVPVDEPVPLHLRPSDLTPDILKDVFGALPKPVVTLEDEIERLNTDLPKEISDAADEVLKSCKGDDAKKREIVEKTLLPMAWDVWQVKALDQRLTQTKDADLDALVKESVQRHIYYDILTPLNIFRHGNLAAKVSVERLADVDLETKEFKVSLPQIKELLQARLKAAIADTYDTETHLGKNWTTALVHPDGNKRGSIEKRQVIAFWLFTLSQVQKPTLNEPLFKNGLERAQTICGLHEFTNAAIYYVASLRVLEDRIIAKVEADRRGYIAKIKDETVRLPGMIDEYESEIDRLVRMTSYIAAAQKRLDDLNKEKANVQTIYDKRVVHYAETKEKLLKARKDTAMYLRDLQGYQVQLHEALLELSDAANVNFRLVDEIVAAEKKINDSARKGGKKQP